MQSEIHNKIYLLKFFQLLFFLNTIKSFNYLIAIITENIRSNFLNYIIIMNM